VIGLLRKLLGRPREVRVVLGDPDRIAAVEAVLAEVRPALRADGGDLRLAEVGDDGLVVLTAHGACKGCGASLLTVQGGIAPKLRERLAWFTRVRVVE
jgi:Fe-S cluster biogenesis protein NfuA